MYFSEQHRAVVYRLRNPDQIVQCIPTARRVDAHTVAVPVRHDTMETCNRLGLPIINPLNVLYDWPGRYKPFAHQRIMAGFMAMAQKCFNLSDMGTGKTLACLWAADYLLRLGLVKKALIVCTLSTMNNAWGDEIFRHFLSRRTFAILHGSVDKRRAELARDVDFYIINHDGLKVRGMTEALMARTDIDLVIVDEASAFKHSGNLRYKMMRAILGGKPRVWLLTGTPAANTPTDAWGLAKLINATPMSFNAFRDATMFRVTNFKWVPKADAAATVARTLQPAIRFKREDCIDLPECIIETRETDLSDKQRQAYDTLKKELALTMRDGTVIDAVNEAVLRGKLIQIACGAVYGPDHEVHNVDAGPKVDELLQVLDNVSAKAIVFAPLTSVVHMLYRALDKEYSAEMVTGAVSQKKRTDIFRAFQEDVEPRVIVADPRAMAHGLTLTAADTIIWFGPIDSLEVYLQANARINRPGQKNRMLIVHLAATPVEREIYRRLAEKESLQGAVLKIVENGK
jgi:SNF2 family DNA or RNA helicase